MLKFVDCFGGNEERSLARVTHILKLRRREWLPALMAAGRNAAGHRQFNFLGCEARRCRPGQSSLDAVGEVAQATALTRQRDAIYHGGQ
jgi:hypothetical protein